MPLRYKHLLVLRTVWIPITTIVTVRNAVSSALTFDAYQASVCVYLRVLCLSVSILEIVSLPIHVRPFADAVPSPSVYCFTNCL